MKKIAQFSPDEGMLPGLGGDGSSMAPNAPSAPEPPPEPKQQVYKGLSSPEDILSDFDISSALKEQISAEDLAHKIWTLYGGDENGIKESLGKIGEWPKEEKENINPSFVENKFKETDSDNKRYKRLADGYKITDIFHNEFEIQRLITHTISTIQKSQKTQTSQQISWYRYAKSKS